MPSVRRRHQPQLRLISERPLSLVGSPSFVLYARPQDDGAMWPALANRCLQALPTRLQWAAPLLDTEHPLPVLCGEPQVVELFQWLDAQPNTARVSIGCQRQTPGTCEQARSRHVLTDERYRPVLEEQLARAEQRVVVAERTGEERHGEPAETIARMSSTMVGEEAGGMTMLERRPAAEVRRGQLGPIVPLPLEEPLLAVRKPTAPAGWLTRRRLKGFDHWRARQQGTDVVVERLAAVAVGAAEFTYQVREKERLPGGEHPERVLWAWQWRCLRRTNTALDSALGDDEPEPWRPDRAAALTRTRCTAIMHHLRNRETQSMAQRELLVDLEEFTAALEAGDAMPGWHNALVRRLQRVGRRPADLRQFLIRTLREPVA